MCFSRIVSNKIFVKQKKSYFLQVEWSKLEEESILLVYLYYFYLLFYFILFYYLFYYYFQPLTNISLDSNINQTLVA